MMLALADFPGLEDAGPPVADGVVSGVLHWGRINLFPAVSFA
jgi:hypothetical protein